MFKKIKNTLFISFFLIFVFFIIKYYLSEQNIIYTNKLRSTYSVTLLEKLKNLPLLSNNTENVITYMNNIEEFKDSRKKRVWEKLITGNDE